MSEAVKLTHKDFASDQDVRWCPGCGDYSVLANVQRVMPSSACRARTSSSCRERAARAASPIT